MTIGPLLYASELDGFAGAPFTDVAVGAVGERIRDACHWHVAPVVTETLTVDSRGGTVLALPTLRLTAVSAVRDVTGTTPVTIDSATYRWSVNGTLIRRHWLCWPPGPRAVEVDVTHGYTKCPTALLEWAAEMLRMSGRGGEVRSEQVGGVSFTYGGQFGQSSAPPVPAEQYRIAPC